MEAPLLVEQRALSLHLVILLLLKLINYWHFRLSARKALSHVPWENSAGRPRRRLGLRCCWVKQHRRTSRLRPLISSNHKKKRAAIQIVPKAVILPSVTPETPPDPTPPPVVESGPVAYEEPTEEEEDEEVEEPCVSALKLMGGNEYGCEVEEEEVF
ncbi:BRF1 RNA polymerase III transcription initiation factor subunit b [Tachysurus ichikawai]